MIKPVRDSLIALILTLIGLAALGSGVYRLMALGENDLLGSIAAPIGGLVALFGLFLVVNFRWAFRIARRMQRGEGVIARWTVPTPIVDAYRAQEAALPWPQRSRWKPKGGTPADILFSADAVLAGGSLHGLSAQGLQTYTSAELVQGPPLMIQFVTREIAVVGDRLTSHRAILRLAVPPGAETEANRVVAHFRQGLTDATKTNPTFWQSRRRIGLAGILGSVLCGGLGWVLAEHSGWNGNDSMTTVALALMITGVMFGVAALFLVGLSTAKLRRG